MSATGRLTHVLAFASTFLALVLGFAVTAGAEPGLTKGTVIAHDAPVLARPSYNYAPAIIHAGDRYHLYWCAGVAGDYVLHAQAQDLAGPWRGADDWSFGQPHFDQAMAPSGSAGTFDGAHACDPNVLRVGGRYYLYYGGLSQPNAGLTAIGVAVSDDAVHFSRLDGGAPIVVAAKTNADWERSKLTYGAGQPAATFIAPYVYLAFTDSTGRGANPVNGAGQFVLRSTDPSFATGVQEFTGPGWEDRPAGRHTAEHSILESFGIDWSYDAASDTILVATDRTAGETTLIALDPRDFHILASGAVPLDWREGPALLAEADKTMPPRPACGTIEVAVLAASGNAAPDSWHALHMSRETMAMGDLCKRAVKPPSAPSDHVGSAPGPRRSPRAP